jgi:hypothetical protein
VAGLGAGRMLHVGAVTVPALGGSR